MLDPIDATFPGVDSILREAGLVRPERNGPFVYYCLPDDQLREIIDQFRDWVNK